ncbi:ERF family protein [Gimesia sp.]|uniref:ERF family protein n=1 Tax=Gimesia sp. TaxID=2024833 RepID=UPI003A943FC8
MNATTTPPNGSENLVKNGHGITQSDSIAAISKALFSVQSQMMAVAKNADNTFCSSKYATLNAVWQTLQPFMKEAGLVVMQTGGESTQIQINKSVKGQSIPTSILLMDFITRVTHSESGEWIQSVGVIPFEKFDPQGFGSAMTYARRYCLSALMGIVVDDDDDANAASGRSYNQPGSQPPQNQQRQQQRPPQNQQQQQQHPPQTGQQQPPANQPPANQAAQQPATALQRLGTFLNKAGCKGADDASLLIDFIAPSHNWQTVQNEEVAKFVVDMVNEGITANRFTVSTVLQSARAAKEASAAFT